MVLRGNEKLGSYQISNIECPIDDRVLANGDLLFEANLQVSLEALFYAQF